MGWAARANREGLNTQQNGTPTTGDRTLARRRTQGMTAQIREEIRSRYYTPSPEDMRRALQKHRRREV
jgi:hypothetical protein